MSRLGPEPVLSSPSLVVERRGSLLQWLPLLAIVLASPLMGAAAGVQPKISLGLVAGALAVLLAVRTPTAALVTLIFLTGVVPYGIQNRFGLGGGVNSPGLLLSDVILLLCLMGAVLAVAQLRLTRREAVVGVAIALFLVLVSAELLRGIYLGRGLSAPGAEARTLIGLGTYLIAVPILHRRAATNRLLVSLIGLAIVLGAWGIIQWVGHFNFGGDVGIRQGVRLTVGGKGQLQGGLFGFPVAIVACYAALLNGAARSTRLRMLLSVAILLNAVSLLLTFERTFWIATMAGLLAVTIRAPADRRLRGILLLPLLCIVFFATLSVFAPAELSVARERFLSINQYSTDDSLRARAEESRHVYAAIRSDPLAGSGLGSTIFWGKPWADVPPKTSAYSHDGYLWVAWKVGIPGTFLLFLVFVAALFVRGSPAEGSVARAVRAGAQGSLLALLIASVTFPTFNALSITPVMGLLLALAIVPLPLTDRAPARVALP